MAAMDTIPKSSGKLVKKAVPWSVECEKLVKERNRAFRKLKRTHNFQRLIEYKKAHSEKEYKAREKNILEGLL